MSTIKVEEIQHPSNSNNAVSVASDSSVSLKHSGSAKLATTSTGVNITGACAATSFSGDGSALTSLPAQTDATKMPLTGGTFTGSVSFEDAINENVYTITDSGSVILDPDNGMIQSWTIGDHRTPTTSLNTGQSMLLLVQTTASNGYTLTLPNTMKWVGGSAPTVSDVNVTAIELFQVGSQLYGAAVGDLS